MTVRPNDPLAAWVWLLASKAAITAVVPAARIVYDLGDIPIGSTNHWIIVSPGRLEINDGFWDGYVQLTFLGPQGHVNQQAQNEVIYQICDPMQSFRVHRIAGGSQEGAVLSAAQIHGLIRGSIPIQGDFVLPFRSINVQTKLSVEAMSWT